MSLSHEIIDSKFKFFETGVFIESSEKSKNIYIYLFAFMIFNLYHFCYISNYCVSRPSEFVYLKQTETHKTHI